MTFVYSRPPEFAMQTHIFPIKKYQLLKNALLDDGLTESDFREPEMADWEELKIVLDDEYLKDLTEVRATWRTLMSELPVREEIIDFYRLVSNGTLLAAREALSKGWAYHIGGGFHHAFKDHAEGFCYINDLAYAILKLKQENSIERAAVIDCDLHQGNGTAHIFKEDPSVFTFSIHQQEIYPIKQKSDLDIPVYKGTDDKTYTELLRKSLPEVLDKAEPELVLYQAGADPYVSDQLGQLELTFKGLAERDMIVLHELNKRKIPCAVTLGGGYPVDVRDGVIIHWQTAAIMLYLWTGKPLDDRIVLK